MNLKDDLYKLTPEEEGGSIASKGFDFQKDWTLCKLLELHEKKEDYLIICDYHDDALVLNHEEDPSEINFFQVKKNSNGKLWTINRLLNRDKKVDCLGYSIIGKLYKDKINYTYFTKSLNFISNSKFSLKKKGSSEAAILSNICVSELDPEMIKKISKQLKEEHGLSNEPDFSNITFFSSCELSPDDSATHTKGKISDFLEKINANGKPKIQVIYNTLFAEIKRKTDYHSKNYSSFEDWKNNKGIGRTAFSEMIKVFSSDKDFDLFWSSVENKLNAEGAGFESVRKLQKSWRNYELRLMNPADSVNSKLCDVVSGIVGEYRKLVKTVDMLTPFFEFVMKKFDVCDFDERDIFTEFDIKAVALGCLYEE